jgi:hypothetical protein
MPLCELHRLNVGQVQDICVSGVDYSSGTDVGNKKR